MRLAFRIALRSVAAVPVIGFLHVANVYNHKVLNVLDKSRIPILGIATGTLEDEKLLGRCHPFDKLRAGSAEGSKALRPQSSCALAGPSGPLSYCRSG